MCYRVKKCIHSYNLHCVSTFSISKRLEQWFSVLSHFDFLSGLNCLCDYGPVWLAIRAWWYSRGKVPCSPINIFFFGADWHYSFSTTLCLPLTLAPSPPLPSLRIPSAWLSLFCLIPLAKQCILGHSRNSFHIDEIWSAPLRRVQGTLSHTSRLAHWVRSARLGNTLV